MASSSTTISVSKQKVLELLSGGQDMPFVIPEYQRPYAWTIDEVCTLFDDLWNFSVETQVKGGPKTYFLGCIVSYEENDERQIIDGQQRITSLFLLLRAIYYKLEHMDSSESVENFKSLIAPALWRKDRITGKLNCNDILLRSEVVEEHANDVLRHILETGEVDGKAKDTYSVNYKKFFDLFEQKSKDDPIHIYYFIDAILNQAILLPISADSQDTALTIFSTLNNRGLPLSDADIFKSQIYKPLDAAAKADFIKKWKELDKDSQESGETIQSLFTYNMFFLRAKAGDDNSTIPGLRKYYTDKTKNRLTVATIDDLATNLNLWSVINKREQLDGEPWSQNLEILQMLDCLRYYKNEYWKYPVSTFYMIHKDEADFEKSFLVFLRKLCAMLLIRFLESPTVNAVKGEVLKLDVEIVKNNHPSFNSWFKIDQEDNKRQLLITPHPYMVRILLMLIAYNDKNQKDLLPQSWEIEHIFPQKWDTSFFTFTADEANEKLEHLGNKVPLEKKLNIKASNGYFAKKQSEYQKSNVAITKELGNSAQNSWILDDIVNRDEQVYNLLIGILKQWNDDYDNFMSSAPQQKQGGLTPEQAAEMIKQLKAAGYNNI